VGDLIVIGAEYAPHGAIPHAVECSDDASPRLEHVTLFASNCFGFLEVNCDGTVYVGCRIDRRPPEDDPVKRVSPAALPGRRCLPQQGCNQGPLVSRVLRALHGR